MTANPPPRSAVALELTLGEVRLQSMSEVVGGLLAVVGLQVRVDAFRQRLRLSHVRQSLPCQLAMVVVACEILGAFFEPRFGMIGESFSFQLRPVVSPTITSLYGAAHP